MEGRNCPLAKRGHSRDGKRGKPQIDFGLLCARHGCPVSVQAFALNNDAPAPVRPPAWRLRPRCGLTPLVSIARVHVPPSATLRAAP